MFYCRENELNKLEKRYLAGKFECAIIYGRRRVGKTSLINEFCKNKPTIYFSTLDASYDEAFSAITEISKDERVKVRFLICPSGKRKQR